MDRQQSVSKSFFSHCRRWQLFGAVFVVLCGVLTIVSSIVFAAEEGQGEIPLPPKDGGGGTIQGIGGVGTTNYIPKFTSSTNLGNSVLYQLNDYLGIGTTNPAAPLDVAGRGFFNYEPFAYAKIDNEDDWSAATGGYTTGSVAYAGSSLGYSGTLGNATAYIGSGEIIPKGWTGTLTFTGYADASNFAQTTDLQGSTDGGATWNTLASMGNSSQVQTLTWNPNPAVASYRLRVVMNTANGIAPGQTVRLQNLKITQLPVFNFGAMQTAGLRIRNGNVGIGTASPLDKLEVAGNLTVGTYDNVFNDVIIRAAGGCPNCGLNTEQGSNLVLRSGIGTGTGQTGDIIFQVSDTANWGNQQLHGILEAMRVQTTSGNVGIGTSSPTSALDVRGPTQISEGGVLPDTSPYATFGITRAADDENYSDLGLTKQGRVPWAFGISNDDRLIIGTAKNGRTIPSPAFSIHPWTSAANLGGSLNLGGNFSITNGLSLQEVRLKHDSDLPNYQAALQFAYDYQNALRLVTWGNDTQVLGAAADGTKVFFPSGNVGIGTTSPGAKLDVAGNINALGNISVVNGLSLQEVRLKHDSDLPNYQGALQFAYDYNNALRLVTWSNDAQILGAAADASKVFFPNGNVGVGTTAPSQKLDVAGYVKGQSGLCIGDDCRTSWPSGGGGGIGGSGSTNYLAKFTGSATIGNSSLVDTGNVGIGTTNPLAKLQVAGSGFFGTASGSLGSSAGPGIRLFYDNGLATPSGTLYAYDYGTNTAKNLILQQPGGNVGIGTVNPAAKLDVAGTTRTTVLTITGGADIAEPFQLVDAERVEPGMVVVIDAAGSGKLRVGTTPYDQRAIGIVSGANGITPGLTLQQTGTAADGTLPVAVSGRVYVLADASYGEITPGTMLTTSATKGHAMAASDASRSHGATVGKALTGLIHGRGYVFMLVALQ